MRNRGISLIVLVITIVVIIILTGAIVLSLSQNNPINKANEAVFKSDMKSLQDDWQLSYSKALAEHLGGTIQLSDIVVTIPTKYLSEVESTLTGIAYKGTDAQKITWVNDIGVKVQSAYLSSMTISSGSLSPVFAKANLSYTDSVLNSVTSVTITSVVEDTSASIVVNGITTVSGQASAAIALNVGVNNINVVVTSGGSTKTYVVVVTRQMDASLSSMILKDAVSTVLAIAPVFSSGTYSYTASTTSATVTIIPTAVVPGSVTIRVMGTTVSSGVASGAIALSIGTNTLTISVTATDGTVKTYTLVVTRS